MHTWLASCDAFANFSSMESNLSSCLMVGHPHLSGQQSSVHFGSPCIPHLLHRCLYQVERKRRKAGAALSHAKVAERLLAAQLRREAISHVKKRQPV